MQRSFLGPRIRQRRNEIGLSQGELAKAVGISPSYMNLIEMNKRNIAGALLLRIAGNLDLQPNELDSATDQRLLESLLEIARLPSLDDLKIDETKTDGFISTFPDWAKALSALARSERTAVEQARQLSDRLSNDPFLSETVHRMLSQISAARSASDILIEFSDIPEERRDRFNVIIHEEMRGLSEVGEALAAYLDRAEVSNSVLTPLDEVEALFDVRDNHFEEIEEAAGPLTASLSDPQPISRRAMARALVDQNLRRLIQNVIEKQPEINSRSAKRRAEDALSFYAESAVLMPLDTFAPMASELRYDVERLAESFSVEVPLVCRRLTALPSQEGRPRFGYYQANAAGTIIQMLGLKGLAFPRYSAACPLWALFRAQQSPDTIIRQRALFPNGDRYIFLARARVRGLTGFGKPRHYVTDMLAMTEDDSLHSVYQPEPSVPIEEVGPNCRLCPRRNCDHRVLDPLAG